MDDNARLLQYVRDAGGRRLSKGFEGRALPPSPEETDPKQSVTGSPDEDAAQEARDAIMALCT